MPVSEMDQLWNAVTHEVTGLGLVMPPNRNALDDTLTNTLIPVVKRKYVRNERIGDLDSVCQITVFRPETPEKRQNSAFGYSFFTYRFVIALVYPGNQDNSANIGFYSMQRDAIINHFDLFENYPPLGVSGCHDMQVEADVWLPKAMFSLGYDYQALAVDLTISRGRPQ